MRKHAAALSLALVIFVAGGVVGVVVDRHWLGRHPAHGVRPWEHAHDEMLEAFRDHLDLTDEQTARIAEIMERTRAAAMEIHARESPAMRELHERAQKEVLDVLTEEQAVEYRRMMQEHEATMHHPH